MLYFVTNQYRQVSIQDWPADMSGNPAFERLTDKQADFYREHPGASVKEVRECKIIPPYIPPVPSITELKENAISDIDTMSRTTIGTVADVLTFSNTIASTVYAKAKGIEPIYSDDKILKTSTDFVVIGKMCRDLFYEMRDRVELAKTKDEIDALVEEARTRYDAIEHSEDSLEKHIVAKLQEIELYDTSSNVNCFYLNETPMWLDKETRISLMNSLELSAAAGKTHMEVWFGDVVYDLEINVAKTMLTAIEMYAMDCYNTTAQHRVEVKALTTIEEVDAFDVTTGYPEKLHFDHLQ